MVCVLKSLDLILFYELHLGLFLGWVIGSGFSSGMSLKIKQNCGGGRGRIVMIVLWLEVVVLANLSSLNKIVNPKSVCCYSSQAFTYSLPVTYAVGTGSLV